MFYIFEFILVVTIRLFNAYPPKHTHIHKKKLRKNLNKLPENALINDDLVGNGNNVKVLIVK